ncbi:MAG TPA: TolC family protein [Pirellulaceae bacterium]|nr:TolC family protein [Pirellulaceae bacterium]
MSRQPRTSRMLLVCLLAALAGCQPIQPFYLHEDGDLSHYLDKATQPEVPDLHQPPLAEVENTLTPFSLNNPEPREIWDLSLEEAVQTALLNTRIIRGGQAARLQNGQLVAGTQEGSLGLNFRAFASTLNVGIAESNPGGRQDGPSVDGGIANSRQGVEAALSEFDAQLRIAGTGNNGAIVSSTHRPQNILPSGLTNQFVSPEISAKQGGLLFELSKRTAEGTIITYRNTNNLDQGITRGSAQKFPSIWTATIETEVRHPLLRGRGSQINRMPIVIARIGTDLEIMNLQGQLQDMLNNLEIRYWDLYFAYRNLEASKVGRDATLESWRKTIAAKEAGRASTQEEAQAKEQYFQFKNQVETALRNVYDAENELRLLMGLSASDGRLIRPITEPTLARVTFDWTDSLVESIARRPELISKRWEIKRSELELIWARNQLLPQLDVGGVYRWLGVGDELINADRNGRNFQDPPAAGGGVGSTAYDELFEGKFQEFGIFLNANMAIGFRRELAGVRHAQLRLAREKAYLEDMELDVSTGLAKAWRNIDTNYELMQTNANRLFAAREEVDARRALITIGQITAADPEWLRSIQRLSIDQTTFWQSVAEYNKAIADYHTRKGSILEYNGVGFEEGPWTDKAYWDAMGLARQRDAGHYIDYGWTRPAVVSRGAAPQGHSGSAAESIGREGAEEIPTPAPAPGAQRESNEPQKLEPMPKPAPPSPQLETRKLLTPPPAAAAVNPLRSGSGHDRNGLRRDAGVQQVQHVEEAE